MFHTAARRFIQFNSPIGRINPVVATRRLYGTQQTDVDTINVMPETPIKLVENGEKTWTTDEIFKGKKVVVFGIPIPVRGCNYLFVILCFIIFLPWKAVHDALHWSSHFVLPISTPVVLPRMPEHTLPLLCPQC